MEAPGYGEEEEPINTILGKVWSVSVWESASSTDEYFDVIHTTVFPGLKKNQRRRILKLK